MPAYFEMLRAEITAETYSKSAYRSELLEVLNRSAGAIEFKHQNISAVLDNLGKKWIAGYKPRHNAQEALARTVESYLDADAELDLLITPTSSENDASIDFDPPPVKRGQPNSQSGNASARHYNAAERDAVNKSLGRKGEERVLQLEKDRLNAAGGPDLADRVEWVSNTKGDGLGCDILSFDEQGKEVWIEVKTSTGRKETPFFITKRELQVSATNPDCYRIYRLFDFSKSPRIYILKAPLDSVVDLEPLSWRAWP